MIMIHVSLINVSVFCSVSPTWSVFENSVQDHKAQKRGQVRSGRGVRMDGLQRSDLLQMQ